VNIKCSNRWAKPVRPVFSRAEPTILVQDDVQTVGKGELGVGQLQRCGGLRHQRRWQQKGESSRDHELHRSIL
jgi:hypothetical protein